MLILPDNFRAGNYIAVIKVKDKDSGPNGLVKAMLLDHKQDFELKESFTSQYLLRTVRQLSSKRHAQYKLKIVAQDQSRPLPQNNSYILHVELADSNRHALRFTREVR